MSASEQTANVLTMPASEPDTVQVAAAHHTAYQAEGWEPVES